MPPPPAVTSAPSLFDALPFGPDLARRRAETSEQMDDFGITDHRLTDALENIRLVNRYLGGVAATQAVLAPLLRPGARLRLLDLGTGAADVPEALVQWAHRRGAHLDVTALEANPVTAQYARAALDRRLPPRLRPRVRVVVADALDLPFADGAFDVAHAALFLHHFADAEAVALLRAMQRVSTRGLVVNDLHRHALAYAGIWLVAHGLPTSPMFRHDAPLSVARAFRRADLARLAAAARLPAPRLRWHWAFRWTLATVRVEG
jgi:2-polyprenyl-3-methyl-5-hydroxy-6-metoxy-1,4-benzoquinol methylase